MKMFHLIVGIIVGIITAFLLKIFPATGYKGVINTQISIYNRLKRRAPKMPENELLNYLINSRIRSIPRVASKEEEYAHYTPLFENSNKTLEDVIWVIVEYEYILSREEYIFDHFSKMGYSPTQISARISDEKAEIRTYVEESIKKKVKVNP